MCGRQMTAETWTARAKLPSFYVLQFEVCEDGLRMPWDMSPDCSNQNILVTASIRH